MSRIDRISAHASYKQVRYFEYEKMTSFSNVYFNNLKRTVLIKNKLFARKDQYSNEVTYFASFII